MGRDRREKMVEESNKLDDLDRRSFVKFFPAMGVAGLVAGSLPPNIAAQTASPSPTPSPTPTKPSPLAEAYAEVTRIRFGDQIQAGQWDQIKRDLEGNVRNSERFRSFKLKNGDEPDFTFTA